MTNTLRGLLGTPTSDLVVSEDQFRRAQDNKAAGFVAMKPRDFLRLTTNYSVYDQIINTARTLDEYNAWTAAGRILLPPTLKVDVKTGRVLSHEGRHRAAALARAKPGGHMMVAIILAKDGYAKRNLGVDDAPDVLLNQWGTGTTARLDKASWYPVD